MKSKKSFSGLPNFASAMAVRVRALQKKNPWFSGYMRPHHG